MGDFMDQGAYSTGGGFVQGGGYGGDAGSFQTPSAGGFQGGSNFSDMSGGGQADYDNEPPILEELGINFDHIKRKTISVLHPTKKLEPDLIDDADMAGPIVNCLLLGATLLLRARLQFGYIYGISGIGCTGMWLLLNLMCTKTEIDIYRTVSVLGYCLLPMVLFSALAVLWSMQGVIGLMMGPLTIGWCTISSADMFMTIINDPDQVWLIRYPVFLLYTCFALIVVF
eukprot:TRINITY_DN3689_c0_g1_i3.p1 TRINITY_DN3689_c0_g1~~TRINITY_DN3689_c0_g1_i3.p1  ORF type:complete len:227 (+),score=36.86 TRINITY_DN3689_c0_g1_i3:179-859(+)